MILQCQPPYAHTRACPALNKFLSLSSLGPNQGLGGRFFFFLPGFGPGFFLSPGGFLGGFFLSSGVFSSTGSGGLGSHGFSGVNFLVRGIRLGFTPVVSMNSLEHIYSGGGFEPGYLHISLGGLEGGFHLAA